MLSERLGNTESPQGVKPRWWQNLKGRLMMRAALWLIVSMSALNALALEQEQLHMAIENYQAYLPNSYLCVCTRFFHRVFDTESYRYVQKKQQQLTTLKVMAQRLGVGHRAVRAYLCKTMAPFLDDYGKRFEETCHNILPPSAHHGLDQDPDRNGCKICFEESHDQVCLMPCGHVFCEECSKSFSKKCPMCRGDVSEILPVDDCRVCLFCKRRPACIMYRSCLHLSSCQDCKGQGCGICDGPDGGWVRLFL